MNPFLTLRRHAEEDEAERRLCERVEPIMVKLERGLNCFAEPEFGWLRDYLLPETDRARATALGKFSVGEITIALVVGRLVTVSEMARESGVPQKTLWRWVTKSGVPHIERRGRKLYNLQALTALLVKRVA